MPVGGSRLNRDDHFTLSGGSRLNRDDHFTLSGGLDSNQRPLAPHTSALPGCATTRKSQLQSGCKCNSFIQEDKTVANSTGNTGQLVLFPGHFSLLVLPTNE
jgi:hypothetical protein